MRLDDSSQMALTSPPEGEYHFFADWQPRPAFYLDGSANTIRFGEFVRISGTLVRDGLPVISGRRLSLWEQPAGSFKDFAPVPGAETTSEDGSFAFEKVQPHANTNYQVRFTGDEKAGLEPAMTAIKPVDVQVLVLLGLWTETLTLGKSITISGKVSPAHPDDEITLTIARNGERVGRTSVTLDKDSRYSLAYEPSRVGEYSVVASFPRDADHAGNTSPTRTFSVGKLGGGMAWEILQRQRTANG